jgi:hypothetical protein
MHATKAKHTRESFESTSIVVFERSNNEEYWFIAALYGILVLARNDILDIYVDVKTGPCEDITLFMCPTRSLWVHPGSCRQRCRQCYLCDVWLIF